MSTKRRQFTREFKLQVIREVEAGKGLAQAAREHQVHPSLIGKWRQQHQKYVDHAFQGHGNSYTHEAKIAELERLIGQLTVENSFLKKVLQKLEAREAPPQ
jgi:transposase